MRSPPYQGAWSLNRQPAKYWLDGVKPVLVERTDETTFPYLARSVALAWVGLSARAVRAPLTVRVRTVRSRPAPSWRGLRAWIRTPRSPSDRASLRSAVAAADSCVAV